MIQQLKYLQDYLKVNNLHLTLQSLRSQILSKYPQAPSNQFMSMIDHIPNKKSSHTMQFTNRSNDKKQRLKKKQQLMVQGLLGKIAYSSKLLQDNSINQKLNKLIDNKIFQKTVSTLFPQNIQKSSIIQQSFQFKDQLQFIQPLDTNINPIDFQPQNLISHIDIQQQSGSSILSQPSLVLQQLNKQQSVIDQYTDDKDLGYLQFVFTQNQLLNGCAKLTKKYGYPERAIKKNTKQQLKTKKNSLKKKQRSSKFPSGIAFPQCSNSQYPIQFGGIIYNAFKIKVIFDRQKTGYQQSKQLTLQDGDILAGRYRKEGMLGKGVFAKVFKVTDLIKNQLTCLKMIVNSNSSKDFFDQALDQIKILRYINANCNPDQQYLIKFKNVFYHRQHLFIETDLMKDNLYIAYQKNQSFFSLPIIKQIAKQVLIALKLLHKLQIIHADLKPQNILIKSYNPISVKVIDLGNSCFFHDSLGQYVQSRSYRAPQVVLGVGYNEKIDIWSLGCILAQLWTKNVLFLNDHIPGMLARIQGIIGPWPQWMLDCGQGVQNIFSKQNLIYYQQDSKFHILIPKITTLKDRIRTNDKQFLNFLQATLKIDPNFRISAEEALMHPFIQSG